MLKQYIGNKKIKSTEDKDKRIIVTFDDKQVVEMNKNLFELVVSDFLGLGNVTDTINTRIASKFILELAELGLERGDIEGIAGAIGNLVHNFSERAICKKFGIESTTNMSLLEIINVE